MNRITVILADDHTLVRAGFRALLEKIPSISVIAEAGNGPETVKLLKKHQPDVALVDMAMPKLNGLEVLAQSGDFPKVRVIILSMHTSEEYVAQALRSGAVGYLIKDAAIGELKAAIKVVMKGGTYLSPRIAKPVVDRYLERQPKPFDKLTPRQREVLQLIAEGNNTKEIAFILRLSVKTIETHRGHIMGKLAIHDVAGLVRYAMRIGLISA